MGILPELQAKRRKAQQNVAYGVAHGITCSPPLRKLKLTAAAHRASGK